MAKLNQLTSEETVEILRNLDTLQSPFLIISKAPLEFNSKVQKQQTTLKKKSSLHRVTELMPLLKSRIKVAKMTVYVHRIKVLEQIGKI